MSVPVIAALLGALAVLMGWLAYRHQRAERPYAKALRALARANGTQPLLPAITSADLRHRGHAARLHRVRTTSTVVLGLLGLTLLAAPTRLLPCAALGAALILRVGYELLVQAKVSNRPR